MRTSTLLRRNLTHYWRTNLAVVLGVATAVAVLAGALLVGESVRASLRDLVLTRLGRTALVVSASSFFNEAVATGLETDAEFATGFDAASPLIALDGVVTHETSGRRAGRVRVYGVDQRFWEFHGQPDRAPADREVLVSPSLARELGSEAGDTLLLRVEQPSAVPEETLHGRRDETGRTVRVAMREVLPADRLGEFSLVAHQGEVRAVFVPLLRLQRDLERPARVNTLLIAEGESASEPGQATAAAARLEQALGRVLSLTDLGIELRVLDARRGFALEGDGVLIGDALAETATAAAARTNLAAQPVLTYLANSIGIDGREIPYSLVTALELDAFFDGAPGEEASEPRASGGRPPIVLNAWAADDLEAEPGDTVTLAYHVWLEEGRLETRQADFRLAAVVPLEGVADDRDLAPAYPGITETDNLSAWDPPFAIDLSRVRPRDEEYWDRYRTTPKAFIPLDRGRELWGSRYGSLTSLRFHHVSGADAGPDALAAAMASYAQELQSALAPAQMGFAVRPARAEGLRASRGATDFGQYFVYFSFFLVVSALLLVALFFKLGVEQRLREVGVLRAVGFTATRVRWFFVAEGIVLSTVGGLVGIAGAVGYGALVMLGLRTWWVDAVGTTLLTLHVSPHWLALGALGGVAAAVVCTVLTLRSVAQSSPRTLLTGTAETLMAPVRRPGAAALRWTGLFGALGLALLVAAAAGWIDQAGGFFGGGASLLIAALAYVAVWLRRDRRRVIGGAGWWSISRLGFRNVTYRVGRSVLCVALIASATFIIVAVDAFRRTDEDARLDYRSGSGGFPLLAESLVPLHHDPNLPEGREALGLPVDDGGVLDAVRFARFRVRPGDDASCLNLYRPNNPRILAPTPAFMASGRFAFQSVLTEGDAEAQNPWRVLERDTADGAIPVIGDANSMTYVLHLGLGEEMVIDVGGEPVRLRLMGTLADSLFQGELLMSEENFVRLFPARDGHRFFLLDVPADATSEAATALEAALSDYGFDVVSTRERIASFHRVENTYLSTFQALGALGLILGTVGLATVLLRNVLERRRELALMRAVGYDARHLAVMVVAENLWLLFWGLVAGTASALLAIAPVLASRGGQPPTASLALLLPVVLATGLAASIVATAAALRSPLLRALRAE